jgi:hypothetical protein
VLHVLVSAAPDSCILHQYYLLLPLLLLLL